MNNRNLLSIAFEDLFKLTVGLIVDDLKVHKHLYDLSLSGSDNFVLNLKLYKKIFALAGFKDQEMSEELEDWYFEQTNRVNELEGLRDEKGLNDLAAEILEGLLNARVELYRGNK